MTDDRTLPEAEDAFLQSLQEAPSPAFAQALGLRLRQMAETDADGAGARHSAPPRPVGRAGWGRQVGLATAAALLLAAAGSILVVVTPNGHAVLADAANSLGLHKYLPQKVLQSGEGFRPPFPVLEPAYVPEGLTLTLVAVRGRAGNMRQVVDRRRGAAVVAAREGVAARTRYRRTSGRLALCLTARRSLDRDHRACGPRRRHAVLRSATRGGRPPGHALSGGRRRHTHPAARRAADHDPHQPGERGCGPGSRVAPLTDHGPVIRRAATLYSGQA
jgi:hypothetical protein